MEIITKMITSPEALKISMLDLDDNAGSMLNLHIHSTGSLILEQYSIGDLLLCLDTRKIKYSCKKKRFLFDGLCLAI